MTDRRGTDDKHVTVPDAVKVGARSDIAKVTVTGSDCTSDNRSKFILRDGKKFTEWYGDCKVHCEETNRLSIRLAMYRQILNC